MMLCPACVFGVDAVCCARALRAIIVVFVVVVVVAIVLIFRGFQSEARGSRRNKQPSANFGVPFPLALR